MPNPRPIPPVDIKEYAEPGVVIFHPSTEHQALFVRMHKCEAILSEGEALEASMSFIKGCEKLWGNEFKEKLLIYLETL